jgi:hypothetical protein
MKNRVIFGHATGIPCLRQATGFGLRHLVQGR